MKKKMIAGVLAVALAVTSFIGFGPVKSTKAAALSGTITLSGSTSVSPLAQELAKQFRKENPNVKINFTNVTGSGAGISYVTKKDCRNFLFLQSFCIHINPVLILVLRFLS